MNSKTILIVSVSTLEILSSKDQGSTVPQSQLPITIPGETFYQPGRIEAKFTKTVSRVHADQFVQGFGLSLFDFSDLNDSTHIGLIDVPIGEEQLWADTLKTFPQTIAGASLVPMAHTN